MSTREIDPEELNPPVSMIREKFYPNQCPSCYHDKHVGGPCTTQATKHPCPCGVEGSLKADAGKPSNWHLLAWDAFPEILEIYNYGLAKGYGEESWRQVKVQRYKDALVRHWIAYMRGEKVDPESGKRHIAHICFNAIAILVLDK